MAAPQGLRLSSSTSGEQPNAPSAGVNSAAAGSGCEQPNGNGSAPRQPANKQFEAWLASLQREGYAVERRKGWVYIRGGTGSPLLLKQKAGTVKKEAIKKGRDEVSFTVLFVHFVIIMIAWLASVLSYLVAAGAFCSYDED